MQPVSIKYHIEMPTSERKESVFSNLISISRNDLWALGSSKQTFMLGQCNILRCPSYGNIKTELLSRTWYEVLANNIQDFLLLWLIINTKIKKLRETFCIWYTATRIWYAIPFAGRKVIDYKELSNWREKAF